MQLLIITKQPDPHVELVLPFLKDVEFIVYDPSLLTKELFSYFNDGKSSSLILSNKLVKPDAIWFRKPEMVKRDELPVPSEYKEFTYSAITEVSRWFYSLFPEANTVSNYWRIGNSSSKWLQLNVASKLGIKTPKTICTNSEKEAKEFIATVGRCIVKPPNVSFVKLDGQQYGSYTRRIAEKDSVDFIGLSVFPCFFQEEIVGADIRLVVMGNSYYSYIIDVPRLDDEADWRRNQYDHIKVEHDYLVPKELGDSCLKMVEHFGLKFGVFDFIRRFDTGEYVFLEINPNGQWAFLDLILSEDILLKRMAKLLVEGE
ncbi:MAG: hypothetical protein EBV07_01500 [Proteobacteria bacterium]|nr:hypothetical protein [Pseudomonadota bacterium]